MLLLLFSLFNGRIWARAPKQGMLMVEAFGGIALHTSELTRLEKKYVDDYDYYIVQHDIFGFLLDSTKLSYDYYRSFFAGISMEYFIKPRFSTALAYQYKSVTQNPDTYYRSENLSSNRLVHLDILDISAVYWLTFKKFNISLKSSLLLGKGVLTRIPVIYSLTDVYESEEEKQFITEYHKELPVSAAGFALRPAIYFISRNGFLFRIGINYEYLKVSMNDKRFDYPSSVGFHEYGISLGLGYSHLLKK